jgi:Novel toxin 16
MYDASLGRFCSRDPVGYEDGPNLFRAYFSLNKLDPSGLRSIAYEDDITSFGNTLRRFFGCNASDDDKCKRDCMKKDKCPNDHPIVPGKPRWTTGWCVLAFNFPVPNGKARYRQCACDVDLRIPGDCRDALYNALTKNVDTECQKDARGNDGIPRCKVGDEPLVLAQLAVAWGKCALARYNVMYACFRGGDQRHINALNFAFARRDECTALLNNIPVMPAP